MFTIQTAIHTIKGDNSKCFLYFRIMPLLRFRLFSILYQATDSRALALACGNVVNPYPGEFECDQ